MQLKWTNLIDLTQTGISKIKEVPGVYRLSFLNSVDNKYYVYYVGQSENLNDRLFQHLSGNETNPCCNKHLENYNCYFKAAAISAQSDRDGAEVSLYLHFKPSCPEKIPDVKPLEINFD